jgi:hypothetical protein
MTCLGIVRDFNQDRESHQHHEAEGRSAQAIGQSRIVREQSSDGHGPGEEDGSYDRGHLAREGVQAEEL